MKKVVFGFTAFFLSLTLLGGLFKIMHWPGAGIGLVSGVAGLALIVIPMIAIYKYRVTN